MTDRKKSIPKARPKSSASSGKTARPAVSSSRRGRSTKPKGVTSERDYGVKGDSTGTLVRPRRTPTAESWALGVLLLGVGIELILVLPIFGPLGKTVSGILAVLVGKGSYVLGATAILVGVGRLAHVPSLLRSHAYLKSLVFIWAISALAAVLSSTATPRLGSFSHLQSQGGLSGFLVGWTLNFAVGKLGSEIALLLFAAGLLSSLMGLQFHQVASSISIGLRNIRERRQQAGLAPKSKKSDENDSTALDGLLFDAEDPSVELFDDDVETSGELQNEEDVYVDPFVQEPSGTLEGEPSTSKTLTEISAPKSAKTISATREWKLPGMGQLSKGTRRKVDRGELVERGNTLQAALARHGVPTRVVGMTVGPTVTRFELELGEGIKVAKILSLQRDIAYAMAAADVRMLAPIPGRSAIGVEVPNISREVVTLGDVMSSAEMRRAIRPLEVPIGRDISGSVYVADLSEMPHVLIAGATGSGKSSALNSILTSILMRATPDEVRMILVDPKRVELGQYSRLPHLLTSVVVDPKKAANALGWAVKEMERRYDLLASYGVRDILGFNQMVRDAHSPAQGAIFESEVPATKEDELPSHLPYILVVVDELNDLMMVAARDVEDSICRIAQKARAVGIHLIIATQRPSVDVITGVIKANVPSRIAFSVASLADSRVILDQPGAEKLIGKGDMLMVSASSSHPRRIQAPWVSEAEVRGVVASWLRQASAEYVDGVEGGNETASSPMTAGSAGDDLYEEAYNLVVSSQLGSTSMLQRKLKVGFARAGRLMDLLEEHGIVGPSEGSKPRIVLMSKEEID